MRLVDVDKVVFTRDDYVSALTLQQRLKRQLDMQPTVEAIPIEWVKKFRNQFDTTDDYYNVIDYMLRLWEKENE